MNSNCGERSINIGNFCLTNDDFIMIILNIIITSILVIFLYIKFYIKIDNSYSVLIKNNFTILGEGQLAHFYTPSNVQQKNTSSKKKITRGTTQNNVIERQVNNNELKCNTCNRSVELSYQYTIGILQQT